MCDGPSSINKLARCLHYFILCLMSLDNKKPSYAEEYVTLNIQYNTQLQISRWPSYGPTNLGIINTGRFLQDAFDTQFVSDVYGFDNANENDGWDSWTDWATLDTPNRTLLQETVHAQLNVCKPPRIPWQYTRVLFSTTTSIDCQIDVTAFGVVRDRSISARALQDDLGDKLHFARQYYAILASAADKGRTVYDNTGLYTKGAFIALGLTRLAHQQLPVHVPDYLNLTFDNQLNSSHLLADLSDLSEDEDFLYVLPVTPVKRIRAYKIGPNLNDMPDVIPINLDRNLYKLITIYIIPFRIFYQISP